MSIKYTQLTLDGNTELYSELTRVISRTADAVKQVHKRRTDPELRVMISLHTKLVNNTANSTLHLSRAELRLLQSILINVSATLYTTVIPNYKNRMEKEPDKADNYKPYLVRCEDRILQYKQILDIIGKAL